jgi:hypothetical protein
MKNACAMFHTCETGFNDGNPPQKKNTPAVFEHTKDVKKGNSYEAKQIQLG